LCSESTEIAQTVMNSTKSSQKTVFVTTVAVCAKGS